MNDYEKKYWSENEFINDGGSYTGYVGIMKGEGYIYGTDNKLVKKNNFSSQFNTSDKFFDRILDEPLQLPHSKKEVQYQPNDWLYRGTVKTIIQNLQENTDYLYRCSTISETIMPTEIPKNVYDELSFLSQYMDSNIVSDCCVHEEYIYLFLGITDKKDKDKDKNKNKNNSNSKLLILRNKHNNFDKNKHQGSWETLEVTSIDSNRANSIAFKTIADVKVNQKEKHLYVVDNTLNMIVRYDIESLFGDKLENNLVLLEMLQGKGAVNDAIYFYNPCSITFDEDYIYIADQGNNCIKKYTQSFDYVKTIKNGIFADQIIECIKTNPYSFTLEDGQFLPKNTLWIFASSDNYIYVYVLYKNTVLYSRRIQKIRLLENEQIKSVNFSQNNSNYYFLCTSQRIYKFHLSKPFYPFGTFRYYRQSINGGGLVWDRVLMNWDNVSETWGSNQANQTDVEVSDNITFSICGNDEINGDIIFHVCKNSKKENQIYLYAEPTRYISSLARNDFMIYTIDDIQDISHDEYINPQTFNKIIYKLANNLIKLKNNILGRFWGAYTGDGIMTYSELEYDDFFQQFSLERVDDLFIHSNEPISIMMNRIFEKIYDVQERLLERMEAKYSVSSLYSYKTITME